jgi:hypothetical protein
MTGTARKARCLVWWTLTSQGEVMRLHKPRNLAKSVTVE